MSGYGSKRRVLVVALMVGALSTGVGFVVLSGRWLPTTAVTSDAQGTAPILSRVPCVAIANGLPCVATVPGAIVADASVTTRSGNVAIPGASFADHIVVAADPAGPVSIARSATKETDLNVVQPDLLLARNVGAVGSSHPGGAGAVFAGSSTGSGSAGSHARGTTEAVGLVNGAQGSQTSASASTPSSSSMPLSPSTSTSSSSSTSSYSSFGAESNTSAAATEPSVREVGSAPGTHAVTPGAPPVAEADVPPVFEEHHTTVSDLTLGRDDSGTPISIVVGGAGEPMSSTPEPSSMLLIGTGVVGLGAFLKRRRAAGAAAKD